MIVLKIVIPTPIPTETERIYPQLKFDARGSISIPSNESSKNTKPIRLIANIKASLWFCQKYLKIKKFPPTIGIIAASKINHI